MSSSGHLVDLSAGIKVDKGTFETDLENSIKVLDKFLEAAEKAKKVSMPTAPVVGAPSVVPTDIAGMIGLYTRATAPAHLVGTYKKAEMKILLEKIKNTYAEASYKDVMREIIPLLAAYPTVTGRHKAALHQLMKKFAKETRMMSVSTLKGEINKIKGIIESTITGTVDPSGFFGGFTAERLERKPGGPEATRERIDLILSDVKGRKTMFYPTELKVFTEPKEGEVLDEAEKVLRETRDMKLRLMFLANQPDYIKRISKYMESSKGAPLGNIMQDLKSRLLGKLEAGEEGKGSEIVEKFFKTFVKPRLEVFATPSALDLYKSKRFKKLMRERKIPPSVISPRPIERIEDELLKMGIKNIFTEAIKKFKEETGTLELPEDLSRLVDVARDMVNSWKQRDDVK